MVKGSSMNDVGFRHVIWDWNGTLFDDAHLCVDVMNRLLAARGLTALTAERYQDLFGFPVVDYYRRLGFDFTRETFEQAGSEFMAGYERRRLEGVLRPEAPAALAAFRRAGVGQSVLSAYRSDTLGELVSHFGIRGFFEAVIGGDDHYARGKTEQGLSWMRQAGISPREVLLIGDTVHDFEVARAMGAACWLIPCGHQSPARLRACGVPVYDSLSTLPLPAEARQNHAAR